MLKARRIFKPPLTLLMLAFSLQISQNNGPLFINLILNVSLPPYFTHKKERKNTVLRLKLLNIFGAAQYSQSAYCYIHITQWQSPSPNPDSLLIRLTSLKTLNVHFGTFFSCFGLFPSWLSILAPKVRPAILFYYFRDLNSSIKSQWPPEFIKYQFTLSMPHISIFI
jgi:hypothetical protein